MKLSQCRGLLQVSSGLSFQDPPENGSRNDSGYRFVSIVSSDGFRIALLIVPI
jgi:hypothetical protein